MKKSIRWLWLLIICILIGCSTDEGEPSIEQVSREILDLLLAEEFQTVHTKWFDDELQNSLKLDRLKDTWNNQVDAAGEFGEIGELKQSNSGDTYDVIEAELLFTEHTLEVRMIFNEELKIVGFNITSGLPNASMPGSIVEETITVGEGTDYELNGLLTLPKENQEKLPAVVLVHGSGPSDKDETVFGYKPFRDIAWGLAQEGIAVIRYDKRTFVYGNEMARKMNDITVYEETVEDAIRATQLVKNDERIDEENVFIVGHSLGAMLAPRIDIQGGDYKGLIMLAGSPRPLWEIIYDQNNNVLETLVDESLKKEQREKVEKEYAKALTLLEMTDEQAKKITVFGINGYYLKEMCQLDAKSLVLEMEKPILMMQGEDDFQVFYEKDFTIWQELLREFENTTLISYPGLNHFFVHYEGLGKGTLAEYQTPKQVEQEVIQDMSQWIMEQIN